MRIVFDEGLDPGTGFLPIFEQAAATALEAEGIRHESCELSLSFADPEEMAGLNAMYRGKEGSTDVLSFPMYENADEIRAAAGEGGTPVLLGDVVINLEAAESQAKEYGHSPERELAYLFVHSVLHLLGYSHEEEDGRRRMREAEEKALGKLGLDR